MSLYQTRLRKQEFTNEYKRREAIDRMKGGSNEVVRLFEKIGAPQQMSIGVYVIQMTFQSSQ